MPQHNSENNGNSALDLFEPFAHAPASDRQAAAQLVRDRISDPATWPEHGYTPTIRRVTATEPGWQDLSDLLVAALDLLGLCWFDGDTLKHHNGRQCNPAACRRASKLAAAEG